MITPEVEDEDIVARNM